MDRTPSKVTAGCEYSMRNGCGGDVEALELDSSRSDRSETFVLFRCKNPYNT